MRVQSGVGVVMSSLAGAGHLDGDSKAESGRLNSHEVQQVATEPVSAAGAAVVSGVGTAPDLASMSKSGLRGLILAGGFADAAQAGEALNAWAHSVTLDTADPSPGEIAEAGALIDRLAQKGDASALVSFCRPELEGRSEAMTGLLDQATDAVLKLRAG